MWLDEGKHILTYRYNVMLCPRSLAIRDRESKTQSMASFCSSAKAQARVYVALSIAVVVVVVDTLGVYETRAICRFAQYVQ